ncbi:kinase-like protein [Podospora aff. communis PSN243]|uniref:Kinase-like protein n=1 Tax=Podospora aff. communis PSN243 TaxID=3040156 RepID=A0AAV9GYY0_9PEZI|nr:kinase-like protein [Podospora aff. communis PSN243]
MARLFSADTVLLGRLSSYTITKELHRPADEGAVYLARSIQDHWRLRNEVDVLKRYQPGTRFLRPLIDEIEDPADPASVVLRYLDSDVLTESNKKRLSRPEIKQCYLHSDGMVHTDVKLDNIFVSYGLGDRFSDIQLGGCGGVVSQNSSFTREGHAMGAAFTRSPETILQLPWGTATDIWSFGTAILSLVFGGGYHLFNPRIEKADPGSDEYEFTALKRMHRFFGPFPHSYQDFKDEDTMTIIDFINAPPKPFHRVGPREVPPADMEFFLKVMKLDPRDRPTAEELLADVWFSEKSQDTLYLYPEGPSQDPTYYGFRLWTAGFLGG